MMFSMFQFLLLMLFGSLLLERGKPHASFDQNYNVTFGFDHFSSLHGGKEVQLFMDKTSGARFESKMLYGSGFFQMDIKAPQRDSAGVVTAFNLSSEGEPEQHDELNFELWGNREGKPYTLMTNVITASNGHREQRIHLWFDPTADFHNYGILWNDHQIVFFVDRIPIRVHKNNTNYGIDYITRPSRVEGSLLNGASRATDEDQTRINWTYAPFKAHFRKFDINGCKTEVAKKESCHSSRYWWNREKFWELDYAGQRAYDYVRKNFMAYDYCLDRDSYPMPIPECFISMDS